MATWEDLRGLALRLPEVEEGTSYGTPSWKVKGRLFVWDRALRKADLAALGDDAPDGPVLGAHVADLGVRDALIADEPGVFFTIPHLDGFPAVLVRLDAIEPDELAEIVAEAWLARAPVRVRQAHPEVGAAPAGPHRGGG